MKKSLRRNNQLRLQRQFQFQRRSHKEGTFKEIHIYVTKDEDGKIISTIQSENNVNGYRDNSKRIKKMDLNLKE
ncbi:hypothetical protein GYK47_03375 [Lactobacillus iners]|nr:hypothetical protein GYK47_03375 [Lactobacillus iners]